MHIFIDYFHNQFEILAILQVHSEWRLTCALHVTHLMPLESSDSLFQINVSSTHEEKALQSVCDLNFMQTCLNLMLT